MTGHITFKTEKTVAIDGKPMKVRGSGSTGVKTNLDVIARGHIARFREGKAYGTIISDTHLFKRFGEIPTKEGWETTQEISNIRHTTTLKTLGFAQSGKVLVDSNTLLRKVLAFKGITFEVMAKDLANFPERRAEKVFKISSIISSEKNLERKNKLGILLQYWMTCKPFAQYIGKTNIEVDLSQTTEEFKEFVNAERNKKIALGIIKNISIGTVKVKNAFINNGAKRVFFDSKSCKPVNYFLENL